MRGLTAADFEREHVRFVASVVCVDTTVTTSVQSFQDYAWQDVRFDERFVEIYTEIPGSIGWMVDYRRLHGTEAIPPKHRGTQKPIQAAGFEA